MSTTRRSPVTFRLPDHILTDLRNEARRRGVSMNKLVEDGIEEMMYKPNADTLAAMDECMSGVELEEFNLSELDEMINEATEEVYAIQVRPEAIPA